jgi:hypothetical protein
MKTHSITFLIIVLVLCSSCFNDNDRNRHIYIRNNSVKAIYYRFSFTYPDTSLIGSDPNNYKINPGEQRSTSASGFAYNSTLQIFILDANVVESEPWDSIVSRYSVLKRFQFTEQEMETKNWIVNYP